MYIQGRRSVPKAMSFIVCWKARIRFRFIILMHHGKVRMIKDHIRNGSIFLKNAARIARSSRKKWKGDGSLPNVTVLVPIYNVESYLRQCLDSLRAQTLQDMEILCLDDGSTDASGAIADAYAKKDERFRVIHKPNEGYGKTMNRGLAEARGTYIGVVESDDFADEEMFQRLYDAISTTGADIVKSNFYNYTEARGSVPVELLKGCPYHVMCSAQTMPQLLQTDAFIWTSLYRKSFLQENGIRFRETPGAAYQDVGFMHKLTAVCRKVFLLPECFLHYRTDRAGASVHAVGKKAYRYNEEFMSYWAFLRQRNAEEQHAGAAAAPNMFRIYRCGVWPYIEPQERVRYLMRAWEEFHQLEEEGFLVQAFWKEEEWKELQHFLAHRDEQILAMCEAVQHQMILREGMLSVLRNASALYLYGAGRVAGSVLAFLQGEGIYAKGILVSQVKGNPTNLGLVPVVAVDEVQTDKKHDVVLIAITPSKPQVQQEIFFVLAKKGYCHVIVLTEELQQALS